MTQELIERTAREWVLSDTGRAGHELERLARIGKPQIPASAEEIVEALVRLAGRMDVAQTRAW